MHVLRYAAAVSPFEANEVSSMSVPIGDDLFLGTFSAKLTNKQSNALITYGCVSVCSVCSVFIRQLDTLELKKFDPKH